MITFCPTPIKVVTPLGDAIAIYVDSSGTFSDDTWCCALLEDGQLRHFVSSQLRIWHNGTYDIVTSLNKQP